MVGAWQAGSGAGKALADAEEEIARLTAALQHARQLQAAAEIAAEDELAAEGGLHESERARALRELQRKHLARAHRDVKRLGRRALLGPAP